MLPNGWEIRKNGEKEKNDIQAIIIIYAAIERFFSLYLSVDISSLYLSQIKIFIPGELI